MYILHVEEGIIEDDKLRKWVRYDIVKNAQISTTGKIYKKSNNNYFADYLRCISRGSSKEILEYLISLNPPLVFQL